MVWVQFKRHISVINWFVLETKCKCLKYFFNMIKIITLIAIFRCGLIIRYVWSIQDKSAIVLILRTLENTASGQTKHRKHLQPTVYQFYFALFHFRKTRECISIAAGITVKAFSFSGLVAIYCFLTVLGKPRESHIFN